MNENNKIVNLIYEIILHNINDNFIFKEAIMAKIFKTDSQEKALKEIIDSLKIIDSINRALKDEEIFDFKIRLSGSTENGNVNETIPMPFTTISSQLKDYRKRLIKDVQDKSKTYSIALDNSEKEILGMKSTEPKKEIIEPENKIELIQQNNDQTEQRFSF